MKRPHTQLDWMNWSADYKRLIDYVDYLEDKIYRKDKWIRTMEELRQEYEMNVIFAKGDLSESIGRDETSTEG